LNNNLETFSNLQVGIEPTFAYVYLNAEEKKKEIWKFYFKDSEKMCGV
tara:strand:+ start:342 stop:485 length:144 start_codon:yes stop_codon:yes gene_type:complete